MTENRFELRIDRLALTMGLSPSLVAGVVAIELGLGSGSVISIGTGSLLVLVSLALFHFAIVGLRGLVVTDEALIREHVFRPPVRLLWAEVERVHYRWRQLVVEGGGKEIVLADDFYRNQKDLLTFIRAHLPGGVTLPPSWWERWTGAA